MQNRPISIDIGPRNRYIMEPKIKWKSTIGVHTVKFFESYYLDDPIVPGRVFDLFAPEKATRPIALFFVHGGGWRAGSRTGFHEIMQGFNREGFICAAADYRLDVDAFRQLQDIREAYMAFADWLRQRRRPARIAVHGSSAGAHLAGLLLLAPPGAAGEPWNPARQWLKPEAGMLQATPVEFAPWPDIFPPIAVEMARAAGKSYAEAPERYRQLSLSSYLSPDNPPLLFLEAENEHMFPSRMVTDFLHRQQALGVPSEQKFYTMAEHGFFYALTRRQQLEAFRDMLDFLARCERSGQAC